MKTQTQKWRMIVAAAWISPALLASAQSGGSLITKATSEEKNRFRAGGMFSFNVQAEFLHQPHAANPGPGVGVHTADHVYDNGFVRVDDSGNAGNVTWNWGFNDIPGQPPSVVGTTLQLQSVASPADGTTQRRTDDPQYGFEVGYGRVLAQPEVGKIRLRVGIDGAFDMTRLDIQNKATISGATTGVMDTYDLSGLPIIPTAPFTGSSPVPGGPLPLLLPDAPITRTPINIPATATEFGKVEGNLFGFKLGPFVEVPLSSVVALQLRAGVAVVLADSKFTFSENISTGGASAGTASRNEWLFGGYVDAQLTVAVAKHWEIFIGGGYQNVGNYSLNAGSQSVKVKLDAIASLMAGLTYSF